MAQGGALYGGFVHSVHAVLLNSHVAGWARGCEIAFHTYYLLYHVQHLVSLEHTLYARP